MSCFRGSRWCTWPTAVCCVCGTLRCAAESSRVCGSNAHQCLLLDCRVRCDKRWEQIWVGVVAKPDSSMCVCDLQATHASHQPRGGGSLSEIPKVGQLSDVRVRLRTMHVIREHAPSKPGADVTPASSSKDHAETPAGLYSHHSLSPQASPTLLEHIQPYPPAHQLVGLSSEPGSAWQLARALAPSLDDVPATAGRLMVSPSPVSSLGLG